MARQAKTTSRTRGNSRRTSHVTSLFGWNLVGWLDQATIASVKESSHAQVLLVGAEASLKVVEQELKDLLPKWQLATLKESKDFVRLAGPEGPIWVLKPKMDRKSNTKDRGLLNPGFYSQARDLAGRWVQDMESLGLENVVLRLIETNEAETLGALVGLDLAAYNYKRALDQQNMISAKLYLDGVDQKLIEKARAIGKGVNIARHLVNTPGNLLNPVSYATAVQELFSSFEDLSIEVWDEKKLAKEKMNLLLAVGRASTDSPRLVKIRYRPQGKSKAESPLALIGKGITFDSGGLDIKPPAGMRLMKKDMGGSATVVGFLYWLVASRTTVPVDVYLPMAENAVAGSAFRPGDIIEAKSGRRVEIHNTDAEGRLILADAMTLASTEQGQNKPHALITVATLTGAAKIGLGSDIAAMFSSDDQLAEKMERGALQYGDWMWRLPLFDGYRSLLKSSVADLTNCASTPFAGPITAALFLNDFASQLPFAHLDIYAWNDKPRGSLRESGGSGQSVQALIGFVENCMDKA